VPSFGELIEELEAQHFVGRYHELRVFSSWLHGDAPEILNVSGPGGIGKSALLREFRRRTAAAGQRVIYLDAHDVRPEPRSLMEAFATLMSAPVELSAIADAINQQQPLVLLDSFEEMADLTSYIRDELLTRVDIRVRVVVAGREPLGRAWRRHDRWQRVIHHLALTGLGRTDARAYVALRGVADRQLVEGILRAAGCHPLALALAVDLAPREQPGLLDQSPAWRDAVRGLVERLLRGLNDAALRDVLDAAAIPRHFDEDLIGEIIGRPASSAFDQLWHLSIVQPAERGLILHDDVRGILLADLQWRRPERYRALRQSTLSALERRMRRAQGAERERLLAERLFLWEDVFARALLFGDAQAGRVWLEPCGPADHAEVLGVWRYWLERVMPSELGSSVAARAQEASLRALLAYPGTRVRLARDRDGRLLGFSTFVPVCRDSLGLLEKYPGVGAVLHAFPETASAARLPATADDARVFFLLHLVHTRVEAETVRAALARDLVGMLEGGGTYLAIATLPAFQRLLGAMGWRHLPDAQTHAWSAHMATEGYVLELSRIGVESWLESLIDRGATPAPRDDMEAATSPSAAIDSGAASLLTQREREIAVLVARGLQNRAIAARLDLSVRTVDAHVEHIRRKLGVHSRAEIAAWVAASDLRLLAAASSG
jgi:DNA-binding CsgD family transcriptional regulator